MVVSLSLVDLVEDVERDNCGNRFVLFRLVKPVEERNLFFLGLISKAD